MDVSPSGEHRPSFERNALAAVRFAFGRGGTITLEALRGWPVFRSLHRRLVDGLTVTEIDVALSRGAAALDGCRLAFLSDVHAGFYRTADDLAALGASLAALEPDVVCLGGDLIATQPHEIEAFGPFLDALAPPLGVHAVLGNHECFYLNRGVEPWIAFLERAGVEVWINGGRRLEHAGASFWLAGLDDAATGTPDVPRALRGARPDEPVVLLSHIPDFARKLVPGQADLVLSGHTHGGQVRLGGWAPITHSKYGYVAGLYAIEATQLYVSRGVGVSALPIRIGTTPEVAVLRLRRT